MKILILEDDQNRIDHFHKIFKEHDVDYTDKSDLAIILLKDKVYDFIFLDHDLGGRVYVDSNEYDTGFRVAKEIPNTINKNSKIVVHSYNPVGARNMVNVLDDAKCDVQYCAFGNFGEEILYEN